MVWISTLGKKIKKEQLKSQVSRRKEIIILRAEVNGYEKRKSKVKL
jgi:hypothetical protein